VRWLCERRLWLSAEYSRAQSLCCRGSMDRESVEGVDANLNAFKGINGALRCRKSTVCCSWLLCLGVAGQDWVDAT